MQRADFTRYPALALTAALVLRALMPLGYMPAAPGSGLLFELCPDQLPPGISMAHGAAHHHHGAHAKQNEADQQRQTQILTDRRPQLSP